MEGFGVRGGEEGKVGGKESQNTHLWKSLLQGGQRHGGPSTTHNISMGAHNQDGCIFAPYTDVHDVSGELGGGQGLCP